MGSFANSMFSVLLGWVRTAANWLWTVLFSAEDGGLIAWIGENWLSLTIILCVVGVAIDLLVHFVRWQPYKVWASFLRRITGRADDQDTGGFSGRMRREWYYADGTARTEEVELPEEEWSPEEEIPPARVSSMDMSDSYVQSFARPEKLRYQEELSKDQPQGLEDYPQPPAPEAPRTGHRKRMARLDTRGHTDELELRYQPVPPAVDKREAYQEPYYPPQWKQPRRRRSLNKEEHHDVTD